jgi:hypothetical protein
MAESYDSKKLRFTFTMLILASTIAFDTIRNWIRILPSHIGGGFSQTA